MTTGQSEVYNNEMGNKMDEVNTSITNQLKTLKDQVDTAATLAQTAQASLNAISAAAKANSFVTRSGNNTFDGDNTFNGTTTIGNLSSPTIDSLKNTLTNNINAVSNSVNSQLAGKLKVTENWTRNYTLGGAFIAPKGGTNQFALSRYKIMDGLSIITGRVTCSTRQRVFLKAISRYHGSLTTPTRPCQMYWDSRRYAYTLPHLGVMDKTIGISMKGKRTNQRCRISS